MCERRRLITLNYNALAPLLLWAAPAAAQTVSDEQFWLNVTVLGSISGDLVYFAEYQPRFGDGVSRVDQTIARAAVGWRLSPRLTAYQGYARVRTPRDGAPTVSEDRSFQQLSLDLGKIGQGSLASRTRLEQRWRSDGRDVGWRLRQMLRYEYPLERDPAPVAALGWVEGMVNLNRTDWGAAPGFDRVRTFAGLELPVHRASTIEVGYMNQTIDNAAGGTTIHHIASVNLFLRH